MQHLYVSNDNHAYTGRNDAEMVEACPVSSPGDRVFLRNCSSSWTRVKGSSREEEQENTTVVVNSPLDQAKFVCRNDSSVHKIVYVTIEGMCSS